MDGVDVKGAYYYSKYKAPLFDQPWINSPKSSINDHAFKFDVSLSSLAARPVAELPVLRHRRRLLQQHGGAA